MKPRVLLLATLLAAASVTLRAQENENSFGITFSGFVKTDVFLDTRKTESFREGHFLLYPAAASEDRFGADINAKANFNILSIQTRIAGKITGPDALGAKTSGLIEGEFFGTSESDLSGFRARHAFLKLDWERSSLLVGQYWHPLFIVEMCPGVVSFNTGAPFLAFSRNPQVRFTQTFGDVRVTAAAMSQRDFQCCGPAGNSSSYLRYSALPDLLAQVQFSSGDLFIGGSFDYKVITPRLVTARDVSTDATVGGIAVQGFTKVVLDLVTLKAEALYGENLSDHLVLGGYAVSSVDTATGIEEYAAIRSLSFWGEISTGKELEFALFTGYAKNLGAGEDLAGMYYGRGTDIDRLIRISPRVVWKIEKLRFAAEVEYTSARYGTPNDRDGGVVGTVQDISNTRLLGAAYYFF